MAFTTPSTWPAGGELQSAKLNEQLRDNMLALTTWTSYSPTVSNVPATVTFARAIMAGGLVHVKFRLAVTGAATGTITLSTPTTMVTDSVVDFALGSAVAIDGGSTATRRSLTIAPASSTAVFFIVDSLASAATVNATVPWTWANGDTIGGTFTYEAA